MNFSKLGFNSPFRPDFEALFGKGQQEVKCEDPGDKMIQKTVNETSNVAQVEKGKSDDIIETTKNPKSKKMERSRAEENQVSQPSSPPSLCVLRDRFANLGISSLSLSTNAQSQHTTCPIDPHRHALIRVCVRTLSRGVPQSSALLFAPTNLEIEEWLTRGIVGERTANIKAERRRDMHDGDVTQAKGMRGKDNESDDRSATNRVDNGQTKEQGCRTDRILMGTVTSGGVSQCRGSGEGIAFCKANELRNSISYQRQVYVLMSGEGETTNEKEKELPGTTHLNCQRRNVAIQIHKDKELNGDTIQRDEKMIRCGRHRRGIQRRRKGDILAMLRNPTSIHLIPVILRIAK